MDVDVYMNADSHWYDLATYSMPATSTLTTHLAIRIRIII